MSKVALIVSVRAQSGRAEALYSRVRQHAATCLEKEAGCERFDVLRNREDEASFTIYEVYADSAALDIHDASEHMAAWRADAGSLIADRERQMFLLET